MWFPCQPHKFLFVSYAFIYSYHQHICTEHHKCFLYVQVVRGLGRSKQILSSLSFKSIKRHEYHTLRWMRSWRSWGQVRTTKVQIQLAGTANPCPKMVKNSSQHMPPCLSFVFRLFILCDGTSSKKGSAYPFLSFHIHSYKAFVIVFSFNEDAILMGPVYNEAAQWMDVKKNRIFFILKDHLKLWFPPYHCLETIKQVRNQP